MAEILAADLHTLTVAVLRNLSNCPPDHWIGLEIRGTCTQCGASAILNRILPVHRKMVLAEALAAIEDIFTGDECRTMGLGESVADD